MNRPEDIATVADLRRHVSRWRAVGDRIALAPTMGALHAGHLSLVKLARARDARVVASIFVNPTQFAPNEDFTKYPRTLEADTALLATVGVDGVFHPSVEEMYPEGFSTIVSLTGPAAAGLEDRFRPTHFQGVATIVAKLLLQAAPDIAVFGEKDFQQLAVIRRMVRDLDMPVEIIGAPIVREDDGLAMSSRNVYLDSSERRIAPSLHRNLRAAAEKIRSGDAIASVLSAARQALATDGFELDYLEARDVVTLAPVEGGYRPGLRLLVAARLGRTRLIDNIAIGD